MSWVTFSRPCGTARWHICKPRTSVLGYSQPELPKLADERAAGLRNLLNALKRTRANKTGLVAVVLTLTIYLHWSSAVVSHSSQVRLEWGTQPLLLVQGVGVKAAVSR
jgi:hypothetical protein